MVPSVREMREAGELERKKNMRKKEERREAGERERKGKEYFNERGERSVIKKYFFFIALSYSTHLKIDVYYS